MTYLHSHRAIVIVMALAIASSACAETHQPGHKAGDKTGHKHDDAGEADASTPADGGQLEASNRVDAAAVDAASEPHDAAELDAALDLDSSVVDASDSIDATEPESDAAADGGGVIDVSCGEGQTLSLTGDYVSSFGEEHLLVATATAGTYSVLVSGPAEAAHPPQLHVLARACNGLRFFVVSDATQAIMRVDWRKQGHLLRLCRRSTGWTSIDAAAAADTVATNGSNCDGAAWLSLTERLP